MREPLHHYVRPGIVHFMAYPVIKGEGPILESLTDSLNQVCAYASDRGIEVALEVLDRAIDKKCLVGPVDSAREIAERVKATHPTFGLLVDLSHIPLLGESPSQALQPVKDHVVHIHIGNAYMDNRDDPAYGDMHPRFGYPGSANDVPELVDFLQELFAIGYLKADGSSRGAGSFELKPVGNENSRTLIANGQRKLVEAWSQVSL